MRNSGGKISAYKAKAIIAESGRVAASGGEDEGKAKKKAKKEVF